MEENRKKFHNDIECVKTGYANGSALDRPLTDKEKEQMIEEATVHFGNFLTALKCDWQNDPNSADTPRRVAKKYLEQWGGRYNAPPEVTSFPSDGYTGMVLQTNIPLISMCSHHHETILGKVHIAYIPGKDARVIGLSKLNRLVEHFGRRGAIQEQLTIAIHQAVDKVCEGNIGVAVTIIGEHQCVSCRGTNHQGSAMVTNHLTGVFMDKPEVRAEYFKSVELASNYTKNS
jgi:GTP cyclohydrolase I